jgi:hypothetical protein
MGDDMEKGVALFTGDAVLLEDTGPIYETELQDLNELTPKPD